MIDETEYQEFMDMPLTELVDEHIELLAKVKGLEKEILAFKEIITKCVCGVEEE